MAEDIRISVGADTTQMESQIANAARKATVVIRPTIDSKGLEKISAPLGRITGQADEFSKSMEAANARVLAFGASVGVLNAVAKSFQSIVTASTQVEASLKEIQVATGETSGNLEKLGKGIFEVARSTGLSFKQASEATLEFARQGGTLEDSLMKAKAALVLTRTTGLDAAEAVKGLTAAVLSFNQVGLDYETVVNKLAAVDTKFAVSSRDLIEGISRSASVAQEAGVSFDELTALITTLQEKTARGGAVIGNALKTIFQRVQTTENLDYIRNLGIAVNDVSGDILPATTIIKKLADEFQNLDSATRKGLLIKIGGGFQIDKLAALLNDISNANGTFNRSLEQSTNAGNQGFRKLEELNKTVQASFDRLSTSGTQFAATVGKIAFSDDFRSILNKTSSFLESLNESISGGEEGGATIGKSIVKGIGSIITGPGALLLAGLGIKLFGDLAKFGVDSLKNQLGVTNVKKEQQDIEKSILGLLLQNTAVQSKIVSLEGNKAAQAEYLLGLYSKQAAALEKMSKLSKDIGPAVYEGGIRLTTEGTKNVKSKTAAGGYMSKDAARKMEMQEAPAGASIREISNFNFGPSEGKGTMIVNSMESVHKTPMGDFVVPSYSKTRTGKPTLFSASGYVPNFAEEKQKENLLRNLNIDGGAYSFAGLTIGGTGSKAVRAKEVTPQVLSQIKDPVLSEALSKYSKLNFSNVNVGNIYRRRDENLDSLQASEKDIKDHFVKKANSALSPQIGSFIKDELSSLGIKPTATMQYMMKNGRKFDFVNDSMAGTFFETMLKMANMSAEDDNFGQFFNDSNSRFDIYGLKPDIAEQYGLPKKFWEYVEIKSSEKALNDELGTKFIQQLSQAGGESLKSKFLAQAKTGAKGYVPNFAKEKISALKKGGKGGGNLGFYYDDGAKESDDYLESGNVTIKRKKNSKNATVYRKEAKNLIEKARKIGNYSEIKDDYGSYLSPKFEYNKILDPNTKESSLGGLVSNLQGAIAEKEFKDRFAAYVKVEDFNAGIDFHDSNKKRLVEIKARKAALGQKEANSKVLAFLGSQEKGKRKNNQSENLDSLLSDIDFTVYESNYDLKTAAEGYVPNFAGTTNFEGSASRYGYKIGQVYNKGEEAIKTTFNNPTTAFSGTVTGKESYGRKYGVTVDEKGIIASILGNNTFVAGKDQRRLLESLATRLSSQGAMVKGSGFNIAGLQGGRLATNPDQVITANIKGKFKKIDYEKLDRIFPRFWKSKGLGDVWEKTKLAATYKASPTSYSEIIKDRPDLQETLSSSSLLRQNNTLLRDAAVEAVLKKDPSVAGFLVDIANSSDEAFLKQQGYGGAGIKYAMPFSGKPFSDIENKAVKEEKIQSQLDAKRKADQYKNQIEDYKKNGVHYKDYFPQKKTYHEFGTWGNYDPVSKRIFLTSTAAKTASKGYIPNFASGDVDGDGTVTRNDPFIKKLMDSAKKFSPVAKELTNNIIGNLLNMPEGIDLFEIIDQLKFVQKTQEPEVELNRIKAEAELKRKFPKKMKRREDFLKYGYKGPPPEDPPTRTAAKGYIPNFSKKAVLDAIDREQKESGLPLSAIKVVQDARVRGAQNPDGYAVINNRDEPDGRVPNFSDPSGGLGPDLTAAIEGALKGLENSSLSLDDAFKRIAENLGVSGEAINQVFDRMTSSGNAAAESTQKAAESGNKEAEQGNKDAQNKKNAGEKEVKTTQDSLYNLIKFQTVLSFATGAISSFGKSGEQMAEILSSASQSLYLFSQAKELGGTIAGEGGISGGFKAGREAAKAAKESGGSQIGAFIKGGGGMAALGALATGAGYAVATYEGIKALDAGMQIWNGTVAKSEKFIEDLTTASEKYNIQLSEQQKRVVSRISQNAAGGTDVGSQASLSMGRLFGTKNYETYGRLEELLNRTNLNNDAQKAILERLGGVQTPQATEQLRASGNQNPTSMDIELKTIENLTKQLENFETESFKNVTSRVTRTDESEIQVGNRNYYGQILKNEEDLSRIKKDILKLDQLSASQGYTTSSAQAKKNSLLKEQNKLSDDLIKLKELELANTVEITTKVFDAVKYQKLITEYIKEQVAPAQQAAYAEATRQEAMLVSANLLKEELDIQTKLKQLELNRITPRENMLSIEKDLLSTTEARRASVDLELKQLEEQRKLQSEIKTITTTKGRETLDKYLSFTGTGLTEGRKTELNTGFQEIIDAGSIKESEEAIRKFNGLLSVTKKTSQEQTQEIQKQVDNYKRQIVDLADLQDADDGRLETAKQGLIEEQKKLETMGASNIVLESMLRIMGQQIDYAKKATAERLRQNAQDSLNLAITKQQNFYFNAERDALRAQLTLKDQALQKEKERLGYIREIQDAEVGIARIGKDTPKDKFSQQLEDIQREADRRKEDLKTRNQEIANANKSKVVQRLSERPETMALAKEASNAKTQDDLISALEKGYSVDEKSFKSSIISAAEEFKKIVIQTANYINPSEKTGETAPTENPIAIARKQAIQSTSYSGKNGKGYTQDFEKQSLSLVSQSNEMQEKITNKKSELENAVLSNQSSEIIEDLKYEINTLEEELQNIVDKYDALSLKLDPFAPPPERPNKQTAAAIAGLEQPIDEKRQEEGIDATKKQKQEAAIFAERSRVEFGLGMKQSFDTINTDVEQFGNTLGKQIPMNFRDGLVDAMKALSDPNATTSLKERLMGVAGAFLSKINDALMTNTANKITSGIGNMFNNGSGFASGGAIKGGSGTKDDVPAMLMGGEYVIRKNVVNKYGKDFFDRLNAGKIKGYAAGGYAELNYDDYARNKQNYVPYGSTNKGGISFDENGQAVGLDNYTGREEERETAIKTAQTDFYSRNQQTGEGGFLMPGQYGAGAIMGQKNLLAFATQQTQPSKFDRISGMGNSASAEIGAGSSNLTLFGLRNEDNPLNQDLKSAKDKALELYMQGNDATKQKAEILEQFRREEEEKRKAEQEQRKQEKKAFWRNLAVQAAVMVATSAVSQIGSNMAQSGGQKALDAKVNSINKGIDEYGGFGTDVNGQALYAGNKATIENTQLTFSEKMGGYEGSGGFFRGSAFKAPKFNTLTNEKGVYSWNGSGYENVTRGISDNSWSSMKYSPNSMNYGGGKYFQTSNPKYIRRAAGGYVEGNGMGDNVPTMLNGGEFVVSKQAVEKVGYNKLQNINSGQESGNMEELIQRLEVKFEELINKMGGNAGNITINVESSGKEKEQNSGSSNEDQQNREMARKIKDVVLGVIRDEKRIGGLLR